MVSVEDSARNCWDYSNTEGFVKEGEAGSSSDVGSSFRGNVESSEAGVGAGAADAAVY